MKPLLKYRGGKSRELRRISDHIPDFKGRYIEPFLGGGAVFFDLKPKYSILNDINPKLIQFYSEVQAEFPRLRCELDKLEKIYLQNRNDFELSKAANPHTRVHDKNEDFYYLIRDMFNGLAKRDYLFATLYYFINKIAYSGMIRYNAKGEFNVPYGRYPRLNTSLVTQAHSNLLNRAEIYNVDYSEVFKMADDDDFMFLDPPYDCVFSDYGNAEYRDGFNEIDHIRLANAYKNLRCKALLVIGRTPLTEKLYGHMIVDEYDKKYAVNIRNRFKSKASHILISNYGNIAKEKFPELEFNQSLAS